MFIIACIKGNMCYWSDKTLFMSLESAQARLKILEEHGKKFLNIFEIMDLKKME